MTSKLNCFFSKSDLVSPLLKSVSMVKIAMHRIRQWYWVRKNLTLGCYHRRTIYKALFRNWLKSLWLEPSAQGDYIRLRFWKNAYAKSDGNKLYILNRFRSGMRCEENQMIKDSRYSRCLKMSHDVSNDVTKYLKISGGTASFKSKGKRCVLKDGPLRNEVAFYISK